MAIWGGQSFVVVDGEEGAPHPRVEALLFSPDSRRVAYVAHNGSKSSVVVDGPAGAEYDCVHARTLQFSPDSRRLAYVAAHGRKHRVVVDGVEGKPYPGIESLCFSPDSRHVAYLVSRSKTSFVLGKQVLGVLAAPLAIALAGPYGVDALTAGWSRSNRWRVVVDGVETREYGVPYHRAIVFESPKRLHVDTMHGRGLHRMEVEITAP